MLSYPLPKISACNAGRLSADTCALHGVWLSCAALAALLEAALLHIAGEGNHKKSPMSPLSLFLVSPFLKNVTSSYHLKKTLLVEHFIFQ